MDNEHPLKLNEKKIIIIICRHEQVMSYKIIIALFLHQDG